MRGRTVFWLVLALVLVGGVGALAAYQLVTKEEKIGRGAQRTTDAAVAVLAVEAERGLIRDTARFSGTLETSAKVVLSPKIDGRVMKLHVDVGDAIQRGQIVAELDDTEFRQTAEQAKAALDVALANVDLAEAENEVARREFDRYSNLLDSGAATTANYERAEADHKVAAAKLEVAKAQVEQYRAALDNANTRLDYARVRAEWDDGGADTRYLGERLVEAGDLLRAHDPIGTVIDLDTLKGIMTVAERDYARLHVGAPVTLDTDAFAGLTFEGKVSRVPPMIQEAARTARVEVEVPNADHRLKPGMFVRAILEFRRKENAVIVPSEALVKREDVSREEGQRGVYRVDYDGDRAMATFVPVETGLEEGDKRSEIVSPVDFTGLVVILGQHLLGERTEVKPMDRQQLGMGYRGGVE